MPVDDATAGIDRPTEALGLEVEIVDLDAEAGSLEVRLLPVPEGSFVGDLAGQLAEPVQVLISEPGGPVTGFDFPANQVLDPIAASLDAHTPAYLFPFDKPHASFRLQALNQDDPVPIDVELVNQTDGWGLHGTKRAGSQQLQVDLDARRELLPVTFSLFYIVSIVVVALTTVSVIGKAILHDNLQFEQVIWLVAMLAVIPAVRNEMPGIPPVGTAVDLFVLLPSVVVIVVALLAAIVVMARHQGAVA